jgi:hypothetical protein
MNNKIIAIGIVLLIAAALTMGCLGNSYEETTTGFDGTHVYKTVCRDNEWIPTGDTCPEEGTLDCFCDIQVTDENDNNLDCKVCVPGAEGPDCQQTGTDGVTTFQLRQGTLYTATASKDGCVDYNGFSSRSFTTPNDTSDFLALRLTRKPTTCPETFRMCIHADDEEGMGVVGVDVRVNNRSVGNTGTDGTVTCYRVANTYTVNATAPSGYTCIKCTETANLTSTTHVYLKIQGESKTCRVEMRVTDQNNLQVDATVNMNGESKRLYNKPGVYFDVEQGKGYTYKVAADNCTTVNDTYTAPMTVGDTKFIKMARKAIFIFRL